MNARFQGGIFTLLVVVSGWMAPAGFGRGADVVFRGAVVRVQQAAAGSGTVTIRLQQSELTVQLNRETEVEIAGDGIPLSGLKAGDFVKVSGYFTPSGIVAKEIQLFDDWNGDVRLRGTISSVSRTQRGVSLTVSGQAIVIDDSTSVSRRGADDRLSAAGLAAGMEIDARGKMEDGRMVARTLLVGKRQDDGNRVRFEGRVEAVSGSHLLIDTQGGGTAVVVIDDSTVRRGTLEQGKEVEINGRLNARLEVEAEWIKGEVEPGDDRGDDSGGGRDDTQIAQFYKAIRLSPVGGSRLEGHAEIQVEVESSRTEQEFEVEIEDALPNQSYAVRVAASGGSLDLGTFRTDVRGRGKGRFDNKGRGTPLPAGFDVRDITRVQVLLNGATVLEGRF